MLWVTPRIQIPDSELELTYVRSSGPGGQNVNKVNSKAVLRWNLVQSPSLSTDLRERLLSCLSTQLTRAGEILLSSDRYRDQLRNREDCLQKLCELLQDAATPPKDRRPTKPSRSSQRRVKEGKSRVSEKKRLRRVSRRDLSE